MTTVETSSFMVIVGMVNGMIGGVILVLPLLVLEAGSITSAIVICTSGIFSYYSCRLCVKHLGNFSDLDESIMHHFNHNLFIKVFYDSVVFFNLFLLLILYFELIVQQWEGMFLPSIVNPVVNFFVLIVLVFVMKYYEFGVSLLAYGIISTVGYCIFLIWMLASSPSGSEIMPKFGSGGINLAASMGQAFAVQTFFIPVLRKNNSQSSYQIYTLIAYICGFSVYMYIAYTGSFGILHRIPLVPSPETIEGYFDRGHWQLYCLEVIYLVHLYSVFPEFLLISSIFGKKVSVKGQIAGMEIIYTICLIAICLIVSLTKMEIGDIIEVNGAVVGFFIIYFLPLITHIQCIYWSPLIRKIQGGYSSSLKEVEIQKITNSDQNLRVSLITESDLGDKASGEIENSELETKEKCGNQIGKCSAELPEIPFVVLDILMMIGMLASGIFVMYEGLANIFS